ncbi:uncharacterized protein KY384_002587 [Bacidia gigantensis]|uniref:uncharacterized protein n=1 Tax=Bacidia gigantensis TaxID=2732470 RepID=UPI001D04797D|nr:uncharacterized protein KY384_002587 [Bacidia gigantensis]KAG8532710.1 hypothetical protein KY384_002587 [Bacidia gigantensis]
MFPHVPTAVSRNSRKPSPYPTAPLYLLKITQLVSAFIVGAVLCFFVDHLRDEAVTHFIFTLYIHLTRTLNPASHLISNAILTVCWLVSLALLTWNLSWTLGHRCGPINWGNNAGIMVCRLYKALTAFAVTGSAATIGALGLDLKIKREGKDRGVYDQMPGDVKAPAVLVNEMGTDGFEPQQARYIGEGHERRSHEGAQAYKVQKPIEAKQFGYEAPSEQTSYGGGYI